MANRVDRQIANLITEELKKSDVVDLVKKDKDLDKHFRVIVKDIIKDMFRVLWQHNNIFNTLSNK